MVAHGRVPYHEHNDHDIREALAQALRERKIRITDRRLLILYLVNIIILASVFFFLEHSQKQSDADRRAFEVAVLRNCQQNRANTINFNNFIDTLDSTYRASPVLTHQQIQQRIKFFNAAKGKVAPCPPVAVTK